MDKCTGKRCPMQYGYKVDECNHTDCPYRTEQVTNADRIRAMSDEELAKFVDGKRVCPPTGECPEVCDDCVACWLEWLQQPSKEEERSEKTL